MNFPFNINALAQVSVTNMSLWSADSKYCVYIRKIRSGDWLLEIYEGMKMLDSASAPTPDSFGRYLYDNHRSFLDTTFSGVTSNMLVRRFLLEIENPEALAAAAVENETLLTTYYHALIRELGVRDIQKSKISPVTRTKMLYQPLTYVRKVEAVTGKRHSLVRVSLLASPFKANTWQLTMGGFEGIPLERYLDIRAAHQKVISELKALGHQFEDVLTGTCITL